MVFLVFEPVNGRFYKQRNQVCEIQGDKVKHVRIKNSHSVFWMNILKPVRQGMSLAAIRRELCNLTASFLLFFAERLHLDSNAA